MSAVAVWQSSDADLLAELAALETRLHSTWAHGWLDREAAEILRCALSPLAAPRPSTDTEIDLRTATHRDADAWSNSRRAH